MEIRDKILFAVMVSMSALALYSVAGLLLGYVLGMALTLAVMAFSDVFAGGA